MTFIDPARFGNEYQVSHPQTTHPGFGDHQEPPPKRKRLRRLISRILGKDGKADR